MASKMSVINDAPEAYTKFVFAEFLEVLLRLALQVHARSELKTLLVEHKLQNTLKVTLPLVNEELRVEKDEYDPYFEPSEGDSTVIEEE